MIAGRRLRRRRAGAATSTEDRGTSAGRVQRGRNPPLKKPKNGRRAPLACLQASSPDTPSRRETRPLGGKRSQEEKEEEGQKKKGESIRHPRPNWSGQYNGSTREGSRTSSAATPRLTWPATLPAENRSRTWNGWGASSSTSPPPPNRTSWSA